VACDVADADQVRAALADLEERLGRVDVLVNVAGILRPGPFLADTRQTWDAVVGTHLSGHINTIGAVLPGMLARGSGRIINLASTGRPPGLAAPAGLLDGQGGRRGTVPAARVAAGLVRGVGQRGLPGRGHQDEHRPAAGR
jgi:gluconate 5-dehydrogenase